MDNRFSFEDLLGIALLFAAGWFLSPLFEFLNTEALPIRGNLVFLSAVMFGGGVLFRFVFRIDTFVPVLVMGGAIVVRTSMLGTEPGGVMALAWFSLGMFCFIAKQHSGQPHDKTSSAEPHGSPG